MSTDQDGTLTDAASERQNDDDLWDIPRVASYLGVSRSTVRRKIEAGEIPYVRIGVLIRFVRSEVERWVREQAA